MARELLRPKSAAARLGISLSQFWILVKRGDLSTFKIGGGSSTFVDSDVVAAYIDRVTPKAGSKRGRAA